MTESGFDGIPSEEFTAALGRVVTQPPDVQVPLDPPAAAS
jgi:hypothetical protein